jgi:hypothetical protein
MNESTKAALYQNGSGWIEDSFVTLDEEWSGGAVGTALDAEGNGLAVWRPDHGSFKYRRYVAGEGWGPTLTRTHNINPYYIWTLARPDASFAIVSNEMEGDVNRAPWAISFE